jgi:hypothetical protein
VIRRLSVAVAAVVLTATAASGCSTFSKNSNAAEAGGDELSVKDFETIANDLASVATATKMDRLQFTEDGEVDGGAARLLLTEWVTTHVIFGALDDAGTVIDDATRTSAETTISGVFQEDWAKFSATTKQFLIDDQTATDSLASSPLISDAQAQNAYEAGLANSNTLCVRYIAFTDSAAADDAYKQLQGGADFATLANASSLSSTQDGGIFHDQTTGSECSAADSLNQTVAQALVQTPIGKASEPITLTGSDGSAQTFIFLQRPWSEVAAAATPVVRPSLASSVRTTLLTAGKAHVDSRYGTWDPSTQAVVPTS